MRLLRADQLRWLNQRVAQGGVVDVDGKPVAQTLAAGLVSDDARVVYRIDDDIPVLLPESGIGTTQFDAFPA